MTPVYSEPGSPDHPWSAIAVTSPPAAAGVTANTAEYIFTPAGIPRIGIWFPTSSKTIRAVPSPPQKRTRSTFFSINALHAPRVSWSDVIPGQVYTTVNVVIPVSFRASSPIASEQVKKWTGASFSIESAVFARPAARGTAPLQSASSRTPSVPFSPTVPPIPAIGLIRNPTRIMVECQGIIQCPVILKPVQESGQGRIFCPALLL